MRHFQAKISKIFWAGGTAPWAPSPDPTPLGRETAYPWPDPSPLAPYLSTHSKFFPNFYHYAPPFWNSKYATAKSPALSGNHAYCWKWSTVRNVASPKSSSLMLCLRLSLCFCVFVVRRRTLYMTELPNSRRNIATRTPTVANANCLYEIVDSAGVICCLSVLPGEVSAGDNGLAAVLATGGQVGLTVTLFGSSFLHRPANKVRKKLN